MTAPVRVEARSVDGGRLLLLTGEVDLFNVAELAEAIGRQVPDGTVPVLLDLARVGYLDSAGVSMLFRLAERLRRQRRELRLVVPTDAPVRRVLELSGVARAMSVLPDLPGPPAEDG